MRIKIKKWSWKKIEGSEKNKKNITMKEIHILPPINEEKNRTIIIDKQQFKLLLLIGLRTNKSPHELIYESIEFHIDYWRDYFNGHDIDIENEDNLELIFHLLSQLKEREGFEDEDDEDELDF